MAQEIIYDQVNGSVKFYTVRETIQPMYGYRNGSIEQYSGGQMHQPNNTKKTLLNIARQSSHMICNLNLRAPLNAQLK